MDIPVLCKCPSCGKEYDVIMDKYPFEQWKYVGKSIQDAWPEGSATDRESLISGLCKNCQEAVFNPELKDYTGLDMPWSDVVNEVKDHFRLTGSKYTAIRVDEYIKYGVIDNTDLYLIETEDLLELLETIISNEDNKNGCQLYADHFRITGGACFSEETHEQVGFRITKVYFQEVKFNGNY